jgi:hypothetical protein
MAIQLKVLLYIVALISLFYIGLIVGHYRELKENCLKDNNKCDISNSVRIASVIDLSRLKKENDTRR